MGLDSIPIITSTGNMSQAKLGESDVSLFKLDIL